MNAPIKRVLPTPVARAKHNEGNSRSKSVTEGNSLAMASSALPISGSFFGGAISVMRSRISSDRRCGGRRLRRPAIALTFWFISLDDGQLREHYDFNAGNTHESVIIGEE